MSINDSEPKRVFIWDIYERIRKILSFFYVCSYEFYAVNFTRDGMESVCILCRPEYLLVLRISARSSNGRMTAITALIDPE